MVRGQKRDKLGDGVGMPPKAACSSTLTEFPRKLLEVGPGPSSAAKEALTASTITVIRAGSWTPVATTGAETVEDVCGPEFAPEASDEGTDDSACGRVSDGEFFPSKLAAKLLVRRALIVQAETASKQNTKAQTGTQTASYCNNTLRRTASKQLCI